MRTRSVLISIAPCEAGGIGSSLSLTSTVGNSHEPGLSDIYTLVRIILHLKPLS